MSKILSKLRKRASLAILGCLLLSTFLYLIVVRLGGIPTTGIRLKNDVFPLYEAYTSRDLKRLQAADSDYLFAPSIEGVVPGRYLVVQGFAFKTAFLFPYRWICIQFTIQVTYPLPPYAICNLTLQEVETGFTHDFNFSADDLDIEVAYDLALPWTREPLQFFLNFSIQVGGVDPPLGILFFLNQFILL